MPTKRALVLLLGALAACSDGSSGPDASGPADAAAAPDAPPPADATPDGGALPDADPSADSGEPPDAGEVRPPDVCDALGLPRQPFDEGAGGLGFGDRAGDFTVNLMSGETWNLRSAWTGCESYVFLVYYPGTYGNALFGSSVDALLTGSRPNVHYFFVSSELDADARRARLQPVEERLTAAIEARFDTEEAREAQYRRIHMVADRVGVIEGSVGAMVADYTRFARTSVVDIGDGRRATAPTLDAFAIDRAQRWDAADNLNEYVGGPVLFAMASYLGAFYDFKAALAARLAAETGVVTRTLVDTTTTARIFETDVALPAMAAFDTLEIDVRIDCQERNPFGCSEWDRIANVFVCADAACATRHELARWITPYWRRGEQRWTIDASPLLGLLRAGGTRRFRVETGPVWERATPYAGKVELRFSTRGGGKLRAVGAVPAFGGGTFDANYSTRDPIRFTPPATAQRVELVTILSGHGQTQPDSCAEWCDHRHQFTVEGVALPEIRPAAGTGSTRGCAERAGEGVPPGQWGNWGPQRAYWCPGLPVPAQSIDVTPHLTLGQEASLDYTASFAGRTPPGGDIALSSYLVWYE